jgi:PAS domain S-box-containing protein
MLLALSWTQLRRHKIALPPRTTLTSGQAVRPSRGPALQPTVDPVSARVDPKWLGAKFRNPAPRRRAAPDAGGDTYRAFFDHAEDSLCEVEVTEDGRFLCRQLNDHGLRVMGVSSAAVQGRTLEQILGPEAGRRTTLALQRCIAEGGLRYEETWATVGGTRITDTILVPLRDGSQDGRVSRILCSMRDITEKRDLERRLAQAQKLQALGQLAGGVAHDFNNILQAIEGSAALVIRRSANRETVEHLARLVLEAATRGSAITRRLLTLARRNELRAESIDIAALLADLQEVLAPTLGAAIGVRVEATADLPPVLADKGQLETVLVNLATNARDAMPQGGTLAIAALLERVPATSHPAGLEPGAYIRLQVADTGTGMDAETASRALEPFFTTKPIDKGTGLGLSMARGFAEQSGGALSLASTPGQGTTVMLWLPVAPLGVPGAANLPSAAAPSTGAVPVVARILVVDDDPLVREMLCAALQDFGHEICAEADGQAALDRLESGFTPDILLTDLCMPGMDGLALIREAQRRRPGLPAILATGSAQDSSTLLDDAGLTGRCDVLRKPFSLIALRDQVGAVLTAHAAERRVTP